MTPTADDSFTDKEIADMAQAISDNGFQYESNKDRIRTALQAAPKVVTVDEVNRKCRSAHDQYIVKNGSSIGFNHWIYLANEYPNGLIIKKE